MLLKKAKANKVIAIMVSAVMVLTLLVPYLGTKASALDYSTFSANYDYFYNFADGSILNQDGANKYTDDSVVDDVFTIKAGTNGYAFNGTQHGYEMKPGSSFEFKVPGAAKITIGDCRYDGNDELTIKSSDGSFTQTVKRKIDCFDQAGNPATVFTYSGTTAATLIVEFPNKSYVPVVGVNLLHKEYNFTDGSILNQDSTTKYTTDTVVDKTLTIKAGTNGYAFNGTQHGYEMKPGSSFEISVSGPTKISIGDCRYTNNSELTITSSDGKFTQTSGRKVDCYDQPGNPVTVFNYTDDAPATLIVEFPNKDYVPVLMLDPIMQEQPDDNGVKKDTTYIYSFPAGNVIPETYDKNNPIMGEYTTDDGLVTFIGKSEKLYWHDNQHGIAIGNGDAIEVKVAGDAIVTFNLCQYGTTMDAKMNASSKKGKFVSETSLPFIYDEADGLSMIAFEYEGVATTLKFTLSADKGEWYCHSMMVANKPEKDDSAVIGNGKADVWDFGGEQLDTSKYNNKLNADIINGFYPSTVKPGTAGAEIAFFKTDEIIFDCGGKTNNRIRTTNTAISRYDEKDATIDGTKLTGLVYSNTGDPRVYLGIKLYENDVLTVYTGANNDTSVIHCVSPTGKIQSGKSDTSGTKLTFYASEYGTYKIYSANGEKLVVYRAVREHPAPVKVSGTVDTSSASGIEDYDYQLCFTNKSNGNITLAEVKDGKYEVYLSEGYTYGLSITNANGYYIRGTRLLEIPKGKTELTENMVIDKVPLVTVTGKLTGLPEAQLGRLKLSFADTKNDYYVPHVERDGDTYKTYLEVGTTYDIVAEGVNDYYLSEITQITKTADATVNIAFKLKPLYDITITYKGIPDDATSSAVLTFTNLEDEYVYMFNQGDKIQLRDGTYNVQVNGTGSVPYVQKLTSNVIVNGKAASKEIPFEKIDTWNFSLYNKTREAGGVYEIDTIGENKYYLGLPLTGVVNLNKIYLLLGATGEINVPANKGDLVTLKYCYSGSFEVNGKQYFTTSGSTDTIETVSFVADGPVTIKGVADGGVGNKGETYFTIISSVVPTEYKKQITVGKDKDFQTINDALAAASKMNRPNNERVEIVIDPGNYEEMLVVNADNISLINAAGDKSSLELKNKGVDIGENVVRITSYYGHGYNYYSMGKDVKYSAEVLAVNKENGSFSTKNPGSGTTKGSYWNSTVVVYANGFEADGIVFENSFNQYISKKESEDIVVMWETGSKGQRPTTYGDTSVQNRSFVERAGAMAIVGDKAVFNNCKFIGRQDTLYGQTDIKAVFQKCDILGAVDFIYGGMTAVFYQCNLVMNTDDKADTDVSYLTAAQQSEGRGYLMYNCTVTSTTPGKDTASSTKSKPGYFGRPWQANTAEVVFYETNVEATDYAGAKGKSLIRPEGWLDTLAGKSPYMYEYNTRELSGDDNTASRVDWATHLDEPVLADGTKITIAAFLGEDWTAELNARGLVLDLGSDVPDPPVPPTGVEFPVVIVIIVAAAGVLAVIFGKKFGKAK